MIHSSFARIALKEILERYIIKISTIFSFIVTSQKLEYNNIGTYIDLFKKWLPFNYSFICI